MGFDAGVVEWSGASWFVKFLEPGGSAHASSLIHIPLIPFLSCVFPV